jgi:peroxiredoxin
MAHVCLGLGRAVLVIAANFGMLAARLCAAEDDRAALAEFHRVAKSADLKQAETAFKAAHPAPPTKQDVEALVSTVVSSALRVMDEARRFQNRFPNSALLAEVERGACEVLEATFGSKALPMPQERAAEVREFVRERLVRSPEDPQLHLLRYRLVATLPAEQRHAALEELSPDSTPEPARSMARERLRKVQWVGQSLDLTFTALDGSKISVAALKGKVVLISFWSTTCQPCLRELPDLKKCCETLRSQGFDIIGISLDTERAELERVVKKEQLPWPQYFHPAGPESPLAQKYGIRSLPVEWLVDREGVLRDVDARENLAGKIESLLKE